MAQMLTFQPDIVTQQLLVRVAELQLLIARNQLLPVLNLNALYQFNGLGKDLDRAEAVMTGSKLLGIDPLISTQQRAAGLNTGLPGVYNNFQAWQIGFTFQMPLGMRAPLANTRNAQMTLLKQRAYLQQIVHQTIHSLARFFIEVDANYKQFKTAARLRAAAAQRLEAQRAFYEEGRITIDRYLDAVSQYASAVALEAQYKTSYNISIVALEEAKGTLLAYDNIAVAEGPHPRKAYIQARDQQVGHRQFHIPPDGNYHPVPVNGPAALDPITPNSPPPTGPEGTPPPLPAPIGPLGPPPTPSGPHIPVGEPNILSQARPGSIDTGLSPASNSPTPAPSSEPAPMPTLPTRMIPQAAGSAAGGGSPAIVPVSTPATPPRTPALATPPTRPDADLPPMPGQAAPPTAGGEALPPLPDTMELPPLPPS
jgi:hypothetical protein